MLIRAKERTDRVTYGAYVYDQIKGITIRNFQPIQIAKRASFPYTYMKEDLLYMTKVSADYSRKNSNNNQQTQFYSLYLIRKWRNFFQQSKNFKRIC